MLNNTRENYYEIYVLFCFFSKFSWRTRGELMIANFGLEIGPFRDPSFLYFSKLKSF